MLIESREFDETLKIFAESSAFARFSPGHQGLKPFSLRERGLERGQKASIELTLNQWQQLARLLTTRPGVYLARIEF